MPIYEFLCRDCEHRYDDLVGVDEPLDTQACPDCRSGDVVKLFSPFAVRSNSNNTVSVDGTACLPGPAGRGGGGCCGGGCGGCG
jgi:putative FmdB family regulatory protein